MLASGAKTVRTARSLAPKEGRISGILESNSSWGYISLGPKAGDNPNAELMDHIAEIVTVREESFEQGGLREIKVVLVKKVK